MFKNDHEMLEFTLIEISLLLGFQGQINEIVINTMDQILHLNLGADLELNDDFDSVPG